MYGAFVRARNTAYGRKLFGIRRLPAPVISIGNITTGGTGKTPLVAWVAQSVAAQGYASCILSRGYGRTTRSSKRVVVSDGHRIMADASAGGDEPLLLAEEWLGSSAVISDADRVEAGRWAIGNLGSRVFILDDGFQHRRLARDLDIVTIDATNPFSDDRLLPLGLLREPLTALARAHCIVVTRSDQANALAPLIARLKTLVNLNTPILLAHARQTKLEAVSHLNQNQFDAPQIAQWPVGAFAAIGNPQAFFDQLTRGNYDVRWTRAYADHFRYTQKDVDKIIALAAASGVKVLLTTTKDAVKLREFHWRMPCLAVKMELVFSVDDENALRALIAAAINRHYS